MICMTRLFALGVICVMTAVIPTSCRSRQYYTCKRCCCRQSTTVPPNLADVWLTVTCWSDRDRGRLIGRMCPFFTPALHVFGPAQTLGTTGEVRGNVRSSERWMIGRLAILFLCFRVLSSASGFLIYFGEERSRRRRGG